MFRVFSPRRHLRVAVAVLALCVTVAAVWRMPAHPTATAPAEGVAVPIIMYHSILGNPSRQGAYVITPQQFEQDLQYLQAEGYTTVVMADLIAYVKEGVPLPKKPVVLTFDDGYYNNYHYAHPLLEQYGMKAVLSPIAFWSEHYSTHPDECDRDNYSHLTWEQLKELAQSGTWEMQNHSYDLHHNDGGQKGAAKRQGESDAGYRLRLKNDLATAQELLREQVGVTPTTFVYPFGAISALSQEVLEDMGFVASLSCEERTSILTRDPACLWRLGRYLRPANKDIATILNRSA